MEIVTSCDAGVTQLNCVALPVAGVTVLQTSTATALALSAAVEPFANPAPSLAVPSHVARLVNFICAFLLGIPAQSLNLSLNVFTLVLALISEIYTSPMTCPHD